LDLHGFQGLQPSEAEDLFTIDTPADWNLPPKEEPVAPKPAAKPAAKPATTKPPAKPAAQPAKPTTKPAAKPAAKPDTASKPPLPRPLVNPITKPEVSQPPAAKPAEAKPSAKPQAPAPAKPAEPVKPAAPVQPEEEMTVHAGEAAKDSADKDDEKDSNSTETSESEETSSGRVDLKVPLNIAGKSQAIGYPAAGRLENASSLNVGSKAYIIKYPAQKQYFGTRLLVEFIQRMGNLVLKYMPAYQILIGDLSDKNGGRQISGGKREHASHQSGLDADISYLTKAHVPAESIVGNRGAFLKSKLHVGEQWRLFKETVASGRVSRYFVNSSVKVGFCRYAREVGEYNANKSALKHLMIEHGHITHFHIRLRCPTDSPRCMPEGPIRQVGKDREAGC
jgi:penicillin-insensitive murein DD-endopeptidase